MDVPGRAGTTVIVPFRLSQRPKHQPGEGGGDVFRCLHILRAT